MNKGGETTNSKRPAQAIAISRRAIREPLILVNEAIIERHTCLYLRATGGVNKGGGGGAALFVSVSQLTL